MKPTSAGASRRKWASRSSPERLPPASCQGARRRLRGTSTTGTEQPGASTRCRNRVPCGQGRGCAAEGVPGAFLRHAVGHNQTPPRLRRSALASRARRRRRSPQRPNCSPRLTWSTGFRLSGLDVVPYDPSVGDESFIGPNPEVFPATYIFGFRKGNVAIVIDAFIVPSKGGDGTLRRGSAGAGGDRCGAAVSAIAAGRLRA